MYILNRTQLIFIGIAVIMLFYLLNRLNFMHNSAVAAGKVFLVELQPTPEEKIITYIIVFKAGGKNIVFIPEHGYGLQTDSIVPVIYKSAEPQTAKVFTFSGFWYRGLLVCILPIMVWSAFGLSYIRRWDKIKINIYCLIPSGFSKFLDRFLGRGEKAQDHLP